VEHRVAERRRPHRVDDGDVRDDSGHRANSK
jgi:hypothetical protein